MPSVTSTKLKVVETDGTYFVSTCKPDCTLIKLLKPKPKPWQLYGKLREYGKDTKVYQKPIIATYTYYYNANDTTVM